MESKQKLLFKPVFLPCVQAIYAAHGTKTLDVHFYAGLVEVAIV